MDGTPFGRYRLLSLIGEGGKVYKAHDTMIGHDVAIKVLATELGAEPGYRQRFRRKANTAARLCPSVPSLIEFAHAVDFSRETFDDDRTLVAVWPRKQVPARAAPEWRRPGSPVGLGGLR